MYIKDQIRWKRQANLEHDNLECFWIEIIRTRISIWCKDEEKVVKIVIAVEIVKSS